ncbi:PH domain-containing protein [Pedobacter frigoris]|uniref:YdbS-like PH domain-containing protein n=1 Tax=Pedobacter frigoris TaxID=2571272 RepID=A0A4U1CLS7_9SPHI|nr:PH domain-containing protein [Pedobacter frigoris]TKC06349.1 hypothetical protein FA047_13650 [Pedobacter frigoris]
MESIIEDFSEPRKQSASGIVVLFANSFQKTVRAVALPLVFVVIKTKGTGHLGLILIAVFVSIALVLAVISYLRYRRFTFFLDEEKQEFIINEGIFNKTTLTIQLNKIQQVNINQSLIQQMIGVYSLDIDTAGSEKKEASIKAIDHETATLLKQKLLSRESDSIEETTASFDAEQSTTPIEAPVLKLSTNTLFKIGITSNYGASLLLISGFIFGALQLFKDYTDAFEIEREHISAAITKGFTFVSLCILLVFALIVILTTNIIRTFLKYFKFEMIRQKRSLAISSGLFTKHNTLLKPNKVQLSAFSQNYFQKKLNLLNMKIRQASFDEANTEESKKTDIEIPGCNIAERDEVLKMILGQVPEKGISLKPNYRFIFLQCMIKIVLPVALFIITGLIHQPYRAYFWVMIPYIPLVGTMLYFEFKRHRLYVNEQFIIKRSGIWDVEHEIIEPYKIQAITAKQYFWHKKADVGHLIVHTAAGILHFKYGNYTRIRQLVNYWTYQVECSEKDWM